MIQIVPQLKVLVACEPVDFRKGIDSLACVCRQQFQLDPFLCALVSVRAPESESIAGAVAVPVTHVGKLVVP